MKTGILEIVGLFLIVAGACALVGAAALVSVALAVTVAGLFVLLGGTIAVYVASELEAKAAKPIERPGP